MSRAVEFLGLPPTYLADSPEAFVAPQNLSFIEQRAAGKRLLDYGCATAGYSLVLGKRGYSCTAIDVEPELIEQARSHGVDARVVEPEAPIPFGDSSFDTVVLFETLEHVPDYEFVLSEARRVTRNNVLISVPNCTETPLLAQASTVLDHYLAEDHVNFFTLQQLDETLGRLFASHEIFEGDYIDQALYRQLFPFPFNYGVMVLGRLGVLRKTLSYRLFADARR
ncbi:MAG: class I SAM-dependent methyltransferase [Actinomycetota bacterium]|nr:class I SAM-dependent methyltransferase [Actinomycetota bacterium]MDQ2980756.1 class I SAM-dependent methyltransferase [Actinomycetota bacterium]